MKLINEKIIEDLRQSLGIKFLPEENRSEIMTNILELISEKAGMKIIETFNDKEHEEFNQIPKENLEQMEDFLIAKNPKAQEIFQQEAEAVKEELLGSEA